jgi:hypothetical protein
MSKLNTNAEPFTPIPKGYKVGPPGKESTVFMDVYKNKQTGQVLEFTNLDKTSPRPDPSKFEPITDVSERKARGGKKKLRKSKRRTTRKRSSTRRR